MPFIKVRYQPIGRQVYLTIPAKTLLKDCERQEARLKGGISAEYNMMKTGYSEVHGLLVEADRIAEDALQVLEYTSKKSLEFHLLVGGKLGGVILTIII